MATTQAPPISAPKKPILGKNLVLRIVVTAAALAFWFWTQALIGSRPLPTAGIGDWTHTFTASANQYLLAHPAAANALLIISSALIDLMAIFLLGRWLFQGEPRPFLGLVMVLGLRQIMQACVSLPAPSNEIWHYPGFPSLSPTVFPMTTSFLDTPRLPSSPPPNWPGSSASGGLLLALRLLPSRSRPF